LTAASAAAPNSWTLTSASSSPPSSPSPSPSSPPSSSTTSSSGSDYKNPIDQCNSLNPLVLPEYILHIFFNALFLVGGEFFSLFLNVPLIGYHVHRYMNRPVMSGPGLYDPTSIMNADTLNKCQREGWIKLAFYLLSFFYYLYGMIYSLISS